jgi:hypothetical protein
LLSTRANHAALTGIPVLRALVLALSLLPSPLVAQTSLETRMDIEGLEFGGRVHVQFNTTSVDGLPSSQFLLRRARLYAHAQINDWIDGVAQVDFGLGRVAARLAFVRLSFAPELELVAGQFKRPWDVFELTSSSQILVVERTGLIRGSVCGEMVGPCSYSRFARSLLYASLDIGAQLQGQLGDRVYYAVSITNGEGPNTADVNGTKSFSGRVEVTVARDLVVAANAAAHDYPNIVTGTDEYAPAVGADVEWGNFDRGPHLQWGIQFGENWRNLTESGDAPLFGTSQLILSYKMPITSAARLEAVEPLARISYGDPGGSAAGDAGWLVTPGLQVFFDDRTKMAMNADLYRPRDGGLQSSFKVQLYMHF